jgi:hypothetical protein
MRAVDHTETSETRLVLDGHRAHGVTRPTRVRQDHLAAVSSTRRQVAGALPAAGLRANPLPDRFQLTRQGLRFADAAAQLFLR